MKNEKEGRIKYLAEVEEIFNKSEVSSLKREVKWKKKIQASMICIF